MDNPVRWGILGAARIAADHVAPAIHGAAGAVLAALATREPARAAPFAALAPGLRVHGSYQALLDDPGVEAVYIPLPNHLHVDWTLRALAAGKHVLCEKPLALAAPEIDRLIAARDAAGRVAAEAFMVCHHPQWHRLRHLLTQGAVGPLMHVEGMFSYRNTDPQNIRNRPETGGGGLRDIGVYPLVTTRFATGAEPLRLQADIRREGGVDAFARVWADFPGFTMSFHCGMRMARRQDMVFHGQTGWIRVPAPFNPPQQGEARLEIHRPDGSVTVERFPEAAQYRLMIEAFGATLRTGAPFDCPLEFSRGNQAALDAILAAG